MKILIILNEDVCRPTGGLGVHVRELCDQFCSFENIELTVVAVDYKEQEGGLFHVEGKSIKRTRLAEWKHKKRAYRLMKIFNTNDVITRYGFITKVITDDLFTENILRFLGREEFDIIHIHDTSLWRVAKNLKMLFKSKLVITAHLCFFISHAIQPKNHYYMFDAQTEASAYHTCDRLITVSQAYKKMLQESYFLDDIEVIYNGVDSGFLDKVEYDKKLRESFGNKPLVVFVGRLVPTKGLSIIYEAVKALPQFNFILIADIAPTLEDISPLFKEAKKMVKEYDNFTWYNYLDQPTKWKIMKIADIGIMPSLHEPFGIVALEWMGLEVPLIVSKIGGLADFCTDDNTTLITPIAKELISAIKDHIRDEKKVSEGLKTAKEFNWKKVAKKTAKIYSEVI